MSEQDFTLQDAIKPKSDQMNYEDVATRTITAKVIKIKRGNKGPNEQPYWLYIDGHDQPYKPCKSMLRVLIAAWGGSGRDWIGQSLTLFGLSTVKWGGKDAGGIRISHVSGIDKPLTVLLTVSRGNRAPYIVQPLVTPPAATQETTEQEPENATPADQVEAML